ncbi:integral membrane protein [Microthyrium microscopicum]|uniref:Integral membrane protein n=1 Tax=Microthyrium microscopicum TaxID=703497 RepID=A0A6A6U680_9PEZI|nr:integral membrane protein [Microthyrium microscopicum]
MALKSPSSRDGRLLNPAAKAFLLAYISTTGPRTLSLLIKIIRQGRLSVDIKEKLSKTLLDGLDPYRLPTFAAVVVGGSKGLQLPIYQILKTIASRINLFSKPSSPAQILALARFLAALVSSWFAFTLLNKPKDQSTASSIQTTQKTPNPPPPVSDKPSRIPDGIPKLNVDIESMPSQFSAQGIPLAGRTLDLTLFAAVRAIDAVFQLTPPPKNDRLKKLSAAFGRVSSPAIFSLSCAFIMHAFFYAPRALPLTYNAWIQRIANVDERIVQALRQARFGNFVYGKETGIGPLVGSMCRDYGWPEKWGNPAVTVPLPCEVVHQGAGPSCEVHALSRLARSFVAALGVYAPLQAVILLRRLSRVGVDKSAAVRRALLDSVRAASFLGSFVALFYYGVCLARTRLGPPLLGKWVTPQMWDSGLCVLGGCCACGFSINLEAAKRQTELMLFVAPRALGIFFPRRYDRKELWKEQAVFALSTAAVLTAVQTRPSAVRGVFGGVLAGVLT